jgi:DNA-binding CsgD family transcriptional regulator
MAPPDEPEHLVSVLRRLDGPLMDALGDMPVAIWIADRLGRVRWLNRAARDLLSARPGVHFSRFVAPEEVGDARERFARKIHGSLDSTVQRLTLNAVAGLVDAELTSVPIRDGSHVIGVMTLVRADEQRVDAPRRRAKPRLTPRQHQVLELLAHGRSTAEIAQALQITEDTVRNHIRYLLAALRVRSRLEAVVVAFRNEWL